MTFILYLISELFHSLVTQSQLFAQINTSICSSSFSFISGSTRRPLQFRRFYSSPQLIPKKSASSQSASPSIEDSTPGPSSLLPHPVPLALAHRMRLLSNFSLSLTKFEAAKDWPLYYYSILGTMYFFIQSLRPLFRRVSIPSYSPLYSIHNNLYKIS